MSSDWAIDLQQQKNEELDFKYREQQLDVQIELLPKNWSKNIINKIIWGDSEHFYD